MIIGTGGVTVVAVATLVVISGIYSFVPVADGTPSCVAAKAWITANAATLPRTVEAFDSIPTGYRRYVFASLDNQAKAAVAQQHYGRMLQDPNVTPQQRDVLRRLIPMITPESYSRRPDDRSIRADLLRVFSSPSQRRELVQLGRPNDTVNLLARLERLVGYRVTAGGAGSCSCSYESNYCGKQADGSQQPCGSAMCEPSSWGCGTGLWYPCDGECITCPSDNACIGG